MDKTIFIDKKGRHWTKEGLNALIDTNKKFKEVLDSINYY